MTGEADYLSVARAAEAEELVKGSSFFAAVQGVTSVGEALAFVEAARSRRPDASHHAWAYLIGSEYRFSDDGEPGGTAGRPMLEVLQRRGLSGVAGVVTRYFGGTKLGAGGLVRAYGGALARALDLAGVARVRPRVRLEVHLPFADMDAAHRLLDAWPGLVKGAPRYDSEGMALTLELPRDARTALEARLVALSRGKVRVVAVRADGPGAREGASPHHRHERRSLE